MTVEESVFVAIATTCHLVICHMYNTAMLQNCKAVWVVIKNASSSADNACVVPVSLRHYMAISYRFDLLCPLLARQNVEVNITTG